MSADRRQLILGIPFFRGTAAEAVREGCRGGLVVFPAAPALKDIGRDCDYREALLAASLVLADSAFMVLCWRLLYRESVSRISGLTYLRALLRQPALREPGASLWVMATAMDAQRNFVCLEEQGITLRSDEVYVAPVYTGAVSDERLLARIETAKPGHVFLTIGGGKQEKLGHFLLQRLSYRPAIHCVGAAIAFMSGSQVKIPVWADRLYLGWLFRTLRNPRQFGPRYWQATALFQMLRRYGRELPPLEPQDAAETFPAARG